jgi:hypothetical protein
MIKSNVINFIFILQLLNNINVTVSIKELDETVTLVLWDKSVIYNIIWHDESILCHLKF